VAIAGDVGPVTTISFTAGMCGSVTKSTSWSRCSVTVRFPTARSPSPRAMSGSSRSRVVGTISTVIGRFWSRFAYFWLSQLSNPRTLSALSPRSFPRSLK